jgi:hypothetical protein
LWVVIGLFVGLLAAQRPARAYSIDANGNVEMRVNFRYTPSASALTHFQQQMERAKTILCDATDGQLKINKVTVTTVDGLIERESDIWVYNEAFRSSSDLADGHVYLANSQVWGDIIAHELGHLIFAIGDEYDEQFRSGHCGIGPSFDRTGSFPTSEVNHTIMQQDGGYVCRDPATGKSVEEFNPVDFDPVFCYDDGTSPNIYCRFACTAPECPKDASGASVPFQCVTPPLLMSEMSVTAAQHDALRGSNNVCPAPRAGTILALNAKLGPNEVRGIPLPGAPGLGCGNRALDTGEQCDSTATLPTSCSGLGFASGNLRCYTNCSFDTRPCVSVATCGDGVLDAGEACEPTLPVPPGVTCASLGLPPGSPETAGTVSCDPNCGFNTSQCPGRPTTFDGSTLEKAAASSNFSAQFFAFDALGRRVNFEAYKPGQASHLIAAYFKNMQQVSAAPPQDLWHLRVLARGEEYGGAVGSGVLVGSYDLVFSRDTGELLSVNGAPPGGALEIELGGSLTGPFVLEPGDAATPPVKLAVRLGGLKELAWHTATNAPGLSRFLANTGVFSGEPGTPQSTQIASCGNDDYCRPVWNTTTQRFETTDHTLRELFNLGRSSARSDWTMAQDTLATRGFTLRPPPGGVPETTTPTLAQCGGALVHEVQQRLADQVIMVLDRSGSMTTRVDGPQGTGATRMAFVQAAARAFVSQQSKNTVPVDVGLISFNQAATMDQDLIRVDATVPPPPPPPATISPTEYAAKIDALQAAGATAIGTALAAARARFATVTGGTKAVLLLSDGENNTGVEKPSDEAAALQKEGVAVYTIPAGKAADRNLLGAIAGQTRGLMLDAPAGDELPTTFAELYAATRGESPTLARTPSAVRPAPACGIEPDGNVCPPGSTPTQSPAGCICIPIDIGLVDVDDLPYSEDFLVPVEAGVSVLNVILSARNAQVSGWNPAFELRDPTGAVVLNDQTPGVLHDPFFRMMNVPNPVLGSWKLTIVARPSGGAQFSFLLAHAENPGPECEASMSSVFTDGLTNLVVTGRAHFRRPLGNGVSYAATLQRPDGSTVPLAFGGDRVGFPGQAVVITPGQLIGRGLYQVVVSCFVSEGASYAAGETRVVTPPDPIGFDIPVVPSLAVPAFVRQVRTAFFVSSTTQPPLPPGGDCDHNGIPDSQEVLADTDQDGLPDVCDEDDDGDDVPDPDDPAPKDPATPCPVGNCVVADAGPDQLLQCTAGGAVAQLDGRGSHAVGNVPLTFSWSAPGITFSNPASPQPTARFPNGATTTATLAVSSPGGQTASDTVRITVVDTLPPVLTVPPDIKTTTCRSPNIGTATAVDACGGPVAVFVDKPAVFPPGTTVVTYRAVDAAGNAVRQTQRVTVLLADDASCCPAGTRVLRGTSNNDLLTGNSGSDCILGFGGQDRLNGGGGKDYISGGEGDDVIDGGTGDDSLFGGNGQDQLTGGTGNDFIDGGGGDDTCRGGDQNDVIRGGDGQDRLFGDNGDDQLFGETGDDRLEGGAGNDALDGGGLHDTCVGGPGNNTFNQCQVQQ